MPLLISDLDDTLVERPPLFRTWATRFLDDTGQPADLLDWLVEEDRGGHRPREELYAAIAARFGYDVPLERFLDEHNEALNGSYRLTSGVRSALEDLRRAGWRLAVVTNGPVHSQAVKVEATGLDRLVDGICISEEVGVEKPDPRIFRTAAERAGTTLESAWVIGDNLDADIAGAQAVEARSVWVKRDDDWLTYSSDTEPDLVAGSFPDAVRLVLEATRRARGSC
jgi:HAD superfamily hydrolase (TIGR01549 family)